jgi:hypothetical protein
LEQHPSGQLCAVQRQAVPLPLQTVPGEQRLSHSPPQPSGPQTLPAQEREQQVPAALLQTQLRKSGQSPSSLQGPEQAHCPWALQPSAQHWSPPQQVLLLGQQVASQQVLSASQHWPPQQSPSQQPASEQQALPAGPQMVVQPLTGSQALAGGPQHTSPQAKVAGSPQHTLPAQPLDGWSQGLPPQTVTGSVQTSSKQAPEQQSLPRQQALPLGSLQRLPQHCRSGGQLVALQAHCPWELHVSPAPHLPQEPPQPS